MGSNIISVQFPGESAEDGAGVVEKFCGGAGTREGDAERLPDNGACRDGAQLLAVDSFPVGSRASTCTTAGTLRGGNNRAYTTGGTRWIAGVLAGVAAGVVAVVLPDAALAGGNPIAQAGMSAVDIGTALGGVACAGGVIGAAAGGMMRNSGILAAGATTAACGGAWAGAPQLVTQIIGGGVAGFGLSDLATGPALSLAQLLFS